MNRPNANSKSVEELISNKIFKVPEYQRNFSWEKKNWEDLWNDVIEGLTTETDHFIGTIILKSTNKNEICKDNITTYSIFDVVDGQQRITTIYLFLIALYRLGNKSIKEKIKRDNYYRIELGNLNNEFFKKIIDNKKVSPKILTNELVLDALNYFENKIKEFKKSNKIEDLTRYLLNSVIFLEFILQDESLAIKAFECLNDRGKPLTLLDKTKSLLMYYSMRYMDNSLSVLINNSFGNVFNNYDLIKNYGKSHNIDAINSNRFGEEEILRFFYHYFALYSIENYKIDCPYNVDITSDDVFNSYLKTFCKGLKQDKEKLKRFVEDFCVNFNKFTEGFKRLLEKIKTDSKIKNLFVFLGINLRVYPLIIGLETENILTPKFINLIETLDLRIYKFGAGYARKDLYRNAISAIKTNPESDKIYDKVKWFITSYDYNFDYGIRNFNYYQYDRNIIKYILWQYEKYRNKKFNSNNIKLYSTVEIEHTFSQDTSTSFPAFNFIDKDEYSNKIQDIGNLCLLEGPLNKISNNLIPERKSEHYQKSIVPSTKSLGFKIENHGYKKEDIIERGEKIRNFCKDKWIVN